MKKVRMYSLFRIVTILIISFSVTPVYPYFVDAKNGNLTFHTIDAPFSLKAGQKTFITMGRTFNSLSGNVGLFGLNFCSDFELRIKKTPDGTLKILSCGVGFSLDFKPSNEDFDLFIEDLANAIEPKHSTQEGFDLRAKLKEMPEYRRRVILELGLLFKPHQENGKWYGNQIKDGWIIRKPETGEFEWNKKSGEILVFDKKGRLIHILNGKNSIDLIYNEVGLLVEARDSHGGIIKFYYNNFGQLSEVSNQEGKRISYSFSKKNELISVLNYWGNRYRYEYRGSGLVKVILPNKQQISVNYDETKKVASLTGFNKNEIYEYSLDEKNSFHRTLVTKIEQCDQCDSNSITKYEYFNTSSGFGKKNLKQLIITQGQNRLDLKFNDKGYPFEISSDSETRYFEYFPNGLLKSKITANAREDYQYEKESDRVNRFNRIALKEDSLNQKTPAFTVDQLLAEYNDVGNLAKFHSLDDSYRIIYDENQIMNSISNNQDKKILFNIDSHGELLDMTYSELGKKPVNLGDGMNFLGFDLELSKSIYDLLNRINNDIENLKLPNYN